MTNTPFNPAIHHPAVFRQCFNCNYEAVTVNTVCPRCQKSKFFTSDSIRMRGVIATVCGLFIAGLMSVVAIFVAILLLGASDSPSTARRLAEEQFSLIAVYGFFALVVGLGLNFVVVGVWMLILGKRSQVLMRIMFVAMAIVFGVGGIITALI